MMIIKRIACSGPNDNNPVQELIDFAGDDSRTNLGLFFTEQKCSRGMPRYDWIREMAAKLGEKNLTATLQIGYEWCEDFCNNRIPEEITEMLEATNSNGEKTFKQLQLNFYLNQHSITQDTLTKVIKSHHDHRFILPYNIINKDFIDTLNVKGVPFDILYRPFTDLEELDHKRDFFLGRLQGYSGGLNAENIQAQLDKLVSRIYPGTSIYLDVYRGVMDEDNIFSIDLAATFIENVNSWLMSEQKKNSA